jgi:histidyl-tRNA synthetase
MTSERFRTPIGTRDVLAPESDRWQALVALAAQQFGRAGYGLVITPVFEDVEVFQRVGEATDVVRKEMYEFQDRSGRHLALKPESTASVVRAYAQHRPTLPWKAWYVAPHFRYEHSQAGRYRQHHQIGAETLGTEDPDLDVEVVVLAHDIVQSLGLQQVRLLVNSLGDAECRPAYMAKLRAYLEERADSLCDEHKTRVAQNPLRVLDCKRAECQVVTDGAPRMLDHLCPACQAHFARVTDGLSALGVPFEIEPRLVRGLDYYTRTTFELQATALESAQNGIGGGGRYDGLAEALGAPPTPGIGFGLGIERLLLACDAEGVFPEPEASVAVWVIDTAGGSHARDLTQQLRLAGVAADRSFDQRSMKSQFRAADRSGARLALIVGEREASDDTVVVRDLRNGGAEESVPRGDVVEQVKKRL